MPRHNTFDIWFETYIQKTMASSKQCLVCLDDVLDDSIKTLRCKYCKKLMCSPCATTYVNTTPRTNFKCVFCSQSLHTVHLRGELGQEFIDNVFLKTVRVSLVNMQLQLLPMYQTYARLQQTIDEETVRHDNPAVTPAERQASARYLADLRVLLQNETSSLLEPLTSVNMSAVVQRCPVETCAGSVTRPSYGCGMCDAKLCPTCLAHKPDVAAPHACQTTELNSVSALRSDTKPCPKCKVPIFRECGCSQMFCTMCKTVFDWNTSLVKKTSDGVHNADALKHVRDQTLQRLRSQRQRVLCACDPDYHESLSVNDMVKMKMDPFDMSLIAACRSRYLYALKDVRYPAHNHPSALSGFLQSAASMYWEQYRQVFNAHVWHNTSTRLATAHPERRTFADINALYLRGKVTKDEFADRLLVRYMEIDIALAVDKCYQALFMAWHKLLSTITHQFVVSNDGISDDVQQLLVHKYLKTIEVIRAPLDDALARLATLYGDVCPPSCVPRLTKYFMCREYQSFVQEAQTGKRSRDESSL